MWLWLREGRPWWVGLIGALVVVLYGIIPTFQPPGLDFGKVYAAYVVHSSCCRWYGDGGWMGSTLTGRARSVRSSRSSALPSSFTGRGCSDGTAHHYSRTAPRLYSTIDVAEYERHWVYRSWYCDLTVKALPIDGVQPSVEPVAAGLYSCVRPFLFVWTKERQLSPFTTRFINYVMSDEGQTGLMRLGLMRGIFFRQRTCLSRS